MYLRSCAALSNLISIFHLLIIFVNPVIIHAFVFTFFCKLGIFLQQFAFFVIIEAKWMQATSIISNGLFCFARVEVLYAHHELLLKPLIRNGAWFFLVLEIVAFCHTLQNIPQCVKRWLTFLPIIF
jgi:hypothetical protein